MANLVLIRHGESDWNARGLITGWADASLTAGGRDQAATTGRQLAAEDLHPDLVYTSALRRAQQTAACLLAGWGAPTPPVIALWQLNERHLGQLQGLDKDAIRRRWGNAERQRWRSDPTALPPPLHPGDPRHPRHDPRFGAVPARRLPAAETIEHLRLRVLECWRGRIVPQLRSGRRVTVVAHRDSLRVLITELEGIDAADFASLEVPPASPRIYTFSGTPGSDPRLAAGMA